jgi:hypothetical protein
MSVELGTSSTLRKEHKLRISEKWMLTTILVNGREEEADGSSENSAIIYKDTQI